MGNLDFSTKMAILWRGVLGGVGVLCLMIAKPAGLVGDI